MTKVLRRKRMERVVSCTLLCVNSSLGTAGRTTHSHLADATHSVLTMELGCGGREGW
ncbi:hypothetical protein BaRGS_00040260, partial [Batillaria attramentaria]